MTKHVGDEPVTGSSSEAEAAAWVVRMASDQRTRSDEQAFAAWLTADPVNLNEYADTAALWQGMTNLSEDDEARAILGHVRSDHPVYQPSMARRWFLGGGVAALAAAASGAFLLLPLSRSDGRIYETLPGEQRQLTLLDGSAIMLNTASKLRVSYSNTERRLFLDKGQAYFQVARDPAKPFRVFLGDDEVRAVGTAFDVRRDGDRARVTLEEGMVALYRGNVDRPAAATANGTAQTIEKPLKVLRPGQQVVLAPTAPLMISEVDLQKTQAWRYGRMILDDAPLGETIADLNRYGGRRIVLGDPALAQLRVSGVFHTGRPEAFVEGVTSALPVRLAAQTDSTLVLESR